MCGAQQKKEQAKGAELNLETNGDRLIKVLKIGGSGGARKWKTA